jgi:hypothetical protein
VKVKITIDTGARSVKAESRPGIRTVTTTWTLDENDEWKLTENMKKTPGMDLFISTEELPGQHSLVFDEIRDGLITFFSKLLLKEMEEDGVQQEDISVQEDTKAQGEN